MWTENRRVRSRFGLLEIFMVVWNRIMRGLSEKRAVRGRERKRDVDVSYIWSCSTTEGSQHESGRLGSRIKV